MGTGGCQHILSGNSGKSFVCELARLFRAVAVGSSIELVALKTLIVLCILLLQKPSHVSKVRDHISCLERHLALWKDSNLNELVLEGCVLQQRLPSYSDSDCGVTIGREFLKHMYDGNVKPAIRLLFKDERGGVLHLNDVVMSGYTEYVVRDERYPKVQTSSCTTSRPHLSCPGL